VVDDSSSQSPDFGRAGDLIRILSTKYDGSLHNDYTGRILDRAGGLVRVFVAEGTPWVGYRGRGAVRAPMTQLFFLDRWYNLFHNHRPVGARNMLTYANVGTPATIEGDTLRWIDLDVDVIQTAEHGILVDDEDEFAEHQVLMSYPPEVVSRVLEARDELLEAAWSGSFPFDRASHLPR